MKDLTVTGHMPGTPCPSCRRGLLIVVCHKDRGSNGIFGPGGHAWDHDIIDRVACTHCSISYETSMRGENLDDHFNGQIEKRLHPAQIRPKGKRCEAHPSIPLKEGSYDDDQERSSMRSGLEPTHLRKYRFCQACLNVCWVGKSEEEKKNEIDSAEFAKNASPELRKATADLSRMLSSRALSKKKRRSA